MSSKNIMTCSHTTSTGNRCKAKPVLDGKCTRHAKQVCVICFESTKGPSSKATKVLQCGHAFHLNCILSWFVHSDKCPSCNTEQCGDPILEFKERVETNLRTKYMNVMQSYETEIQRLQTRASHSNSFPVDAWRV